MIVKINGLTWKVQFVDRETIDGSLGLTSFRRFTMNVAIDVANDIVRSTITHEIIHMFLESYGFTADSNGMMFSEEQVCDFIAMNLSSINELTLKIYFEYKKKYNIK